MHGIVKRVPKRKCLLNARIYMYCIKYISYCTTVIQEKQI